MNSTRREFIRNISLFAGGLSFSGALPTSIQKALSIDAESNTTFLDAEHIVFLMQENRSFDHCFGSLSGVRGFNDPRALIMHNQLPVWFQTDKNKNTYGPFRLDIENTKITWMGGLPHSWKDMVEARNDGKMDNWLTAKQSGNKEYKDMPLTMGYYTRDDIPFYYALADAFTVCDQHFCSSLTGTSANRSFFWAGAIRENPRNPESVAHVDNGQINYKDVNWTTYPERLEKAGISWKVYQNELSLPVGFDSQQENWLANFTDNNLEFYKQYNVRFHKTHVSYLELELNRVNNKLKNNNLSTEKQSKLKTQKDQLTADLKKYSSENFEKLSDFEKTIHQKAFITNTQDPNYHELEEIEYDENGKTNKVKVPKGDILYQFRKEVNENKLPTVSWLVAPCNFSDHPGAPWFGAWYVSEVIDILTKNPEVWKKTIFILTYDENDGYFDHIAPFVPPLTTEKEQGKVPVGMDTQDEWVTKLQEQKRTGSNNSQLASPIGLGYRVPMVIASPWTKGGWVNSEVCDLTSTLQFLEYFIEQKTGKQVIEENISNWRREVCGNLTSVFQTANDLKNLNLDFVNRNKYIARILNAREKDKPGNFNSFKRENILSTKVWNKLEGFPKQEKGIKKACALPYNMEANLSLAGSKSQLQMDFLVTSNQLKNKLYSAPFQVHSGVTFEHTSGRNWNFASRDSELLNYYWKINDFEGDYYDLRVHGSNGFFRHFKGNKNAPDICVKVKPLSDLSLTITLRNNTDKAVEFDISDSIYLKKQDKITVSSHEEKTLQYDYSSFEGWYDAVIKTSADNDFMHQFAGHIENGKASITDPYMASLSNDDKK